MVAIPVQKVSNGTKIEFRNDDGGNVHAPVGRLSFAETALAENIEALLAKIRSMKPAACKGQYLKKASLSATMTPSVRLAVE